MRFSSFALLPYHPTCEKKIINSIAWKCHFHHAAGENHATCTAWNRARFWPRARRRASCHLFAPMQSDPLARSRPQAHRRASCQLSVSLPLSPLARSAPRARRKMDVVPDVRRDSLAPHIQRNVLSGTTISSDEMNSYRQLVRLGYIHGMRLITTKTNM